MTKFRTGDPVRIIARYSRYFDEVGTVDEIVTGQDHPFRVVGMQQWPLYFGAHELVLAEAPVTDTQGVAVGAGGAVVAPLSPPEGP